MTYATVTTSIDGPIGTLALDNPTKLNPLSVTCIREITDAAHYFDRQDDVKVVVVRGNGRAFTAGADLAAFLAGGLDRAGADAGRIMVEAVTGMKAVTVGAIHGHCVGGGVLLAGACDFRVATTDVRFVIPEVDLGIPLAWGGIPRLVREVGPAATRDLVLSCRPFTAAEAKMLGFVTRVVEPDQLDEAVSQLAQQLVTKSWFTLKATLRAVDAAAEQLVSTRGAWSDADILATATHDSESQEARARYLKSLGR